MPDESLRVVGVDRVQDVEHVGAITHLSFGKRIWHERHELRVLRQLGPEILDGQFVVMRHVDPLDVVFTEKPLLATEDIFQEVLCDGVRRRNVQLH